MKELNIKKLVGETFSYIKETDLNKAIDHMVYRIFKELVLFDGYLITNKLENNILTVKLFNNKKLEKEGTFFITIEEENIYENEIKIIKQISENEEIFNDLELIEIRKAIKEIESKNKIYKDDYQSLIFLKTRENLINNKINIISTARSFYKTNENNVYKDLDKNEAKKIIKDNMPAPFNITTSMEMLNEVFNRISITNTTDKDWNCGINKNEEIVFKNRVYNFKNDTTRKITHNDMIDTYINTEYVKTNKKPKAFLNFLNSAISKEEVSLLQEFMGYTFKLKADFKNYLILKGVRNSGKSTISDIFMEILGGDNICSVRPTDLESPEKSYGFKGKLLNLVPEMRKREKITDDIKKFTSGGTDPISIRKRYAQEEMYVPLAKTILVTNYDIKFEDDSSGAIELRTLIIDFKKEVEEDKIDRRLVQKLLKFEKNEIINWAIEGLVRLEKERKFTKTKQREQDLFNKDLESNVIFNYIVENIEKYNNTEVLFKDFRDSFLEWSEEQGYKNNFTVKYISGKLKEKKIKTKDKRVNGERGVYIIFNLENTIKIINDIKEEEQKEEEEEMKLLGLTENEEVCNDIFEDYKEQIEQKEEKEEIIEETEEILEIIKKMKEEQKEEEEFDKEEEEKRLEKERKRELAVKKQEIKDKINQKNEEMKDQRRLEKLIKETDGKDEEIECLKIKDIKKVNTDDYYNENVDKISNIEEDEYFNEPSF